MQRGGREQSGNEERGQAVGGRAGAERVAGLIATAIKCGDDERVACPGGQTSDGDARGCCGTHQAVGDVVLLVPRPVALIDPVAGHAGIVSGCVPRK